MRLPSVAIFCIVAVQVPLSLQAPQTWASTTEPTTSRVCQIYFEHDSSTLTPEAVVVVNDMIRRIKKIHPRVIKIIGHADRTGPAGYNSMLSKQRALSVASFMKIGLSPERYIVKVLGHGEYGLPYPTRDGVPEPLNRCVGFTTAPSR